MNLADLATVLVLVSSSISAPVYAHSRNAAWWLILIALIWGILFGLIAAFGTGRAAYWLLGNGNSAKSWISCFTLLTYLVWPVCAIAITIFICIGTTSLFVR